MLGIEPKEFFQKMIDSGYAEYFYEKASDTHYNKIFLGYVNSKGKTLTACYEGSYDDLLDHAHKVKTDLERDFHVEIDHQGDKLHVKFTLK